MNKPRRMLAGAASGLAMFAIAVSVVCLDTVDSTPLEQSRYYSTTTNRWHTKASQAATVSGELSAGFGRALLTPTINAAADEPAQGRFRSLPLAGYGDRRGRPATGVQDDLYVKAVALQVADRLGVLISADALIIPADVAQAALKELELRFSLRREQVYFSATHTHSSIGGWGEGVVAEAFAGSFQPGARDWFASRIVEATGGALSDIATAEFGHGRLDEPARVRNRLDGKDGAVDSAFDYALVKRTDGKSAVIGSFAAHATVLSSRVMEFSGDYPGYWQRAIESDAGGMAIFLAGAIGSHSPVPAKAGFEGAREMGEALANRVLQSMPQVQLTNRVTFSIAGLELDLPELHARLTGKLRFRPWLASRFLPVSDKTFLQGFRLNQLILISTPCDFSGELALEVKAAVEQRGYQAVVTSFNGDYIGYVIPAKYYSRQGYEPRVMSFHGPTMAGYMVEMMKGMALHLAAEK
jgi:neutral ceramidase